MPQLDVTLAGRRMRLVELDTGELIVGRGTAAHLVLAHPVISRKHFAIQAEGARHFIEDLNSTSGVYRGDEAIGRVRLEEGDEVEVGPFVLRYTLASSAAGESAQHSRKWAALRAEPEGDPEGKDLVTASALRSTERTHSDEDRRTTYLAGLDDLKKLQAAAQLARQPHVRVRFGDRVEASPVRPLPFRVGHDDSAELRIPGERRLGRWRFVIDRDEHGWFVRRLSPWVAVEVDGHRVTEPAGLSDGARVRSGGIDLRFFTGAGD